MTLGLIGLLLVLLTILLIRVIYNLVKGVRGPEDLTQVLKRKFLTTRTLVYVLACLAFYPVIAASWALARYSKETVVKTGLPAPDFEALGMDGSTIRLSEFRGKYVLLDFWFSTCRPCVEDTPHLKSTEGEVQR